jgi:hypothetical protein
MLGSYDSRKIDRFEEECLFVSTASVTDSKLPYETAISHPAYNEGEIVIVEKYDDADAAQEGHVRWVATMTSDELPDQLLDRSDNNILEDMLDIVSGSEDWRVFKKGQE